MPDSERCYRCKKAVYGCRIWWLSHEAYRSWKTGKHVDEISAGWKNKVGRSGGKRYTDGRRYCFTGISKTNNNYISAVFYLNDTAYYGLIDEYDLEKNELYLKNVIGDFNKDIIGTSVITSGLSDSFSKGLLIGKIKDIKKDTYGISNIMVIKPAANFNNLNVVTVVVGDK